jgi:outer membrane receptor for ferrienterochelin and colicin
MDAIRVSDFSAEGVSQGRDAVGILKTIPAEMVARIEVPKGPSATRFGVGSSNGVILI